MYAANGIWDELRAQDRRERYDRLIVPTATAMAVRLTSFRPDQLQGVTRAHTPLPDVGLEEEPPTSFLTATPTEAATDTPHSHSDTVGLVDSH